MTHPASTYHGQLLQRLRTHATLFARYSQTARSYRPQQIAYRLGLLARRHTIYRLPGVLASRYTPPPSISLRPGVHLAGSVLFSPTNRRVSGETTDPTIVTKLIEEVREGCFTFLNQQRTLGRPIDWTGGQATRLWTYNLHYGDYLVELAELACRQGDMQIARELVALLDEWIVANPIGCGIGWHAYPTARRIVARIQATALLQESLDPSSQSPGGIDASWQTRVARSLYQQTLFLADHLEYDSLGNHLLADARALIFAGLFFDGPTANRWHEQGLTIFWQGLHEQILADGSHYERSPMYHALVFQDYLEVISALRSNGRSIPTWVEPKIMAMVDWLTGLCHPDGEFPLFHDAAFGITSPTPHVLQAAHTVLERLRDGSPPSTQHDAPEPRAATSWRSQNCTPQLAFPESGYYVLPGNSDSRLILDARSIGPDHIPAHGHCSLFSYELSVQGQRLIVDSGVAEYAPGPWRDYWRSTRAHNTVTVDGQEQSDLWATFRVGRRARMITSTFQSRTDSSFFYGAHDGFTRSRKGPIHHRYILSLPGDVWFVLDRVTGEGVHSIESFIHFHPNVLCEVNSDRNWQLTLGNIQMRLLLGESIHVPQEHLVRGELEPIQGWYAPQFGRYLPVPVLILSCADPLPVTFGYALVPAGWDVTKWTWDLAESPSTRQNLTITLHRPSGNRVLRVALPGAERKSA